MLKAPCPNYGGGDKWSGREKNRHYHNSTGGVPKASH